MKFNYTNCIKNNNFLNICLRRISALFFVLGFPSGIASESYSPYPSQTFPNSVYWGDTHLHTSISLDSNIMGNKFFSTEEAYQFARGETLEVANGMKIRMQRPLDFLVVSDHAEELGIMKALQTSDSSLINTDIGKRLLKIYKDNIDTLNSPRLGDVYELSEFNRAIEEKNAPFQKTIWQRETRIADKYNAPGKFTAFSGYEWTSLDYEPAASNSKLATFANLHRVVIFKDGSDITSQTIPFTANDSKDPERLWEYFEEYEKTTGGEVLAIPHNSNLSYGKMFSLKTYGGQSIDQNYAKTRSRWEPLLEVTQIKGDSETHPLLSPSDEFADYETWNSWYGKNLEGIEQAGVKERKKYEYARSGLQLGLSMQAELGVNPFKFGLIGSTDSHTGLANAGEDNYFGKFIADPPSPERIFKALLPKLFPKVFNWESSASGYAAVWAQENTRESLFAAMKRREVYASTGPRITVRFFGGWDFEPDDALRSDLARIGYLKGVPMGGDLVNAAKDASPNFLIRAIKDPDGANLDRVQVVKGWRDSKGQLHEKVYNVALSDDRAESPTGKVPPVGNTVNMKDASYINSIGDSELAVVWQDPDFNRNELAFYYLRVLVIPTPRWPAYDVKFFGLENVPSEVPLVTQERAYSSPIWYTPLIEGP